MPPKIPFFTGLKVGKVRSNSPSSTTPATLTTGATLSGPETLETDMTEQKVYQHTMHSCRKIFFINWKRINIGYYYLTSRKAKQNLTASDCMSFKK